MKKLLLILILAVSGWSATGDIVSVSIDTSGWFANIEIEGLDTNGTYNLGENIEQSPEYAKINFTISSEGYNTSLVRSKHSRLIQCTKPLRNVYPYNEDYADTLIGGNVVCKIALSSAIFERDSFITVNIGSGFYTQGIESNNSASDLSVTNNSNAEYPKVIGNWSYPGQSVVTDDFTVRGCFAHYSAENGKMIQGVKFTATDQHGHTFTSSVLNPIFSNDSIIEFFDTIDVSGFTVGDQITVNWTAYPIWGDSLYTGDGVNTWPTPYYCPQYYKYVADRYCAVVDVNMEDDASGQVILNSTFNPSAPPTAYKNMFAAINAIGVAMGTADVAGGIIYLRNGNHARYGGTITAETSASYWFEIRNFPNETPVINTISGSARWPIASYIKYKGLSITISTGIFADGEKGSWFDGCTDSRSGGQLIASGVSVNFITNTIMNTYQRLPYSNNNNPVAIFRGNSINYTGAWFLPYMIIGNRSAGSGKCFSFSDRASAGQTAPYPDNIYIGYNYFSHTSEYANFFIDNDKPNHGLAFVQNILERYIGTNPLMRIAADGTTSSPVNNIILWHNTFVGERLNYAYNDYNMNGVTPPPFRMYWSIKNNIFHRVSSVADVDPHSGTAGAPRDGGWYVRYGVQRSGNVIPVQVYSNEFWGFKYKNPNLLWSDTAGIINYLKFVDDASYIGTNDGMGDYHLTEGSEAIGIAYDFIVPFDLDGNLRYSGGAAGAYEYGAPPQPTKPQSLKFDIKGTLRGILRGFWRW
jgi:hypothetical protein